MIVVGSIFWGIGVTRSHLKRKGPSRKGLVGLGSGTKAKEFVFGVEHRSSAATLYSGFRVEGSGFRD